jgi:hypothetical protein
MAQITSHEELMAWLREKPRDWAQVITARAALRVLPYAFGRETPQKWVSDHALSLIRAIAISWGANNYPAYDMVAAARNAAKVADAAYGAANHIAAAYTGVADFAFAAAHNASKDRDIYASNQFEISSYAAVAAGVWANVNQDCIWLDKYPATALAARQMTSVGLWPAGKVDGWRTAWDYATNRLLGLDASYQVWIDWCNLRFEGGNDAAFDIPGDTDRTEDKAILARLADATNEDFWDKGATYVNTTLQSWIDEARARVSAADSVSGDEVEIAEIVEPETSAPVDFFISYSTKEEATAREVEAILSERGYTSIAQFKNFAQGNFVRLMREGIDEADRFIALQSKAYWESSHCQSEWDAAYARDPGAKQRKIVPFLLEPAPLPPIASELVYQPLFSMTVAERRKAVIEWIEYQPPSRSPVQLRNTLAQQASPDVRVQGKKIDAGPNTLFDKPLVDMDLAELPSNLRALLKVLIGSLPDNTPPVVRNCLNGYNEHLLERGAQPIVGTIDPFAEAVRVQIVADAGYWDVGLESLFESFFKRHELLITHFPLNPERELLVVETPIDEVKASGDVLLEPVEAVAKAMAELKSADLTTEDFDRVEEAHRAFSRDIASLPMPKPSDEVTPKRRYVLGTIGFYERLLAALGAAAGIAATPQGQAAIAAVSSAIETFMGFIL